MQCGDLDRYLEAFLDRQLDREGGGGLRHHLARCSACQARVERLRQFERDTQRRFRALERSCSVWEGLEFDLVASSRATAVSRLLALPRALPPPRRGGIAERPSAARRGAGHPTLVGRARGRGQASRVVGVLLLAMALGAVYQLGRPYLQPADDPAAATAAFRQFLQDGQGLAVRSADALRLQAWMAEELKLDVRVPPAPAGYRLVGADRVALAGVEAGMLVYDVDHADSATPVLLFVRALPTEPLTSPPAALDHEGLRQLSWEADSARYMLVGDEPAEELRQFVD